jgi:chromosome segregation ATPase
MKAAVIQRHRDLLGSEAIARVVDRLRGETVAAQEADSVARRELVDLQNAQIARDEAYHRMNGECEALRGERRRLVAEIGRLEGDLTEHREAVSKLRSETKRLQSEESGLRSHLAEQDEHLRRLYAEIERLTELIEAMENTTAWKLHRRVEKLRGRT